MLVNVVLSAVNLVQFLSNTYLELVHKCSFSLNTILMIESSERINLLILHKLHLLSFQYDFSQPFLLRNPFKCHLASSLFLIH